MSARAAERASHKLVLAALGLLVLGLTVGPLAVLVQERWSPLLRLDGASTRAAERLVEGVPGLLTAARVATRLGDPLLITLASLALIAVLLARGSRRQAAYVLLARLGALLLSSTIKVTVERARPVFEEPVDSAYGYSFPSGHALGSAAFWLSTAVLLLPLVAARRRLLAAAVLIPVLVAASRVLLGVHYLSDVLAGLVLGFGWVLVLTPVFALERPEGARLVEPHDDGLQPELADG